MEEKCIDQFETIALNLTKSSSSITASDTCSKKASSLILSSSSTSSSSSSSTSSLLSPSGSNTSTDQISLKAKEDFDKPTTSRSSMSLLQEDFETNSQHDFAEVLDEDDETTTSGVLEAFEISSSNLLPNTNDDVTSEPVAVVDDSSSTDAIQIIKVSDTSTESAASNNRFFNTSEIFVINDDDDDDDGDNCEDVDGDVVNDADDDDDIEEVVEGDLTNTNDNIHIEDDDEEDEEEEDERDMNITNNSSKRETQNTRTQESSRGQPQNNGVIMSSNGTMIFLETPVVEEQHHHHDSHTVNSSKGNSHNNFINDKNMKPKRLSDEFSKNSENGNETPTSSTAANSKLLQESNDMIYDLTESQSCSDIQAHERMSSRLKKMNLNHNNTNNNKNSQDLPTSSSSISSKSSLLISTLTDIESMDLIERRDFEHEQRLTGGIILKSSALIKNNVLDLGLAKSQQQLNTKNDNENSKEEQPSSSHCRRFSSDSKCTYKDLTATPTSSRKLIGRLTKSTAKMNLCNTLSHKQLQQQPQELTTKASQRSTEQIPKSFNHSATSSSLSLPASFIPANVSGITTNSTSVIVEAVTTQNSEFFSNSNSNDSLTSRPSSTSLTLNKRPEVLIHKQTTISKPSSLSATEPTANTSSSISFTSNSPTIASSSTSVAVCTLENSCSRTSAIQPIVSNCNPNSTSSSETNNDDVQPSTSSARCQYAPPLRTQRQVNASAQTSERYLSRSNVIAAASVSGNSGSDVCLSAAALPSRSGSTNNRRADISQNLMDGFRMLNDHLDNNFAFDHQNTSWIDCEENNSDVEEICTCHQSSISGGSSHGGSISDLNDVDELDSCHVYGKDGGADLSYNILHNLSISEEVAAPPECVGTRKRKYTDSRLMEHDYNLATITGSGGTGVNLETNSRKRVAYDFTSTPRSSQTNAGNLVHISTPSQLLATSSTGSPVGRRTPRSLIPTRDNPPPELQQWLSQFQRWSHAERLLAVDRLIEHCEPTQVRHMMKVIEPQFQRDFISLLPRELALQVLSYLDPKDLLRAAQTCRSWRFLCDDNLLWKEKCRQAQILTEPRTDRPKRGRAGNMPPIASPWKAAYMRQHIIEMNWRSRPIRQPKVLKGHDEHVITCLQFSGNRIVSGSDDNTLKVWSAVTGRVSL